ncbi:MAG: hypothetical protein EOP04_15880 [Proteobacteria bacterium]|nr:MAG: hypothetical protein EOP04_15880 [Pseudomonadota bacterium]
MKLNIKCLLPLILLTACGGGGGGGSKKGTTKLPEPLPGPSSNCAIDDIICLNQPKTCVPPLVLDPSTNLCQFVRHDSNNCGENENWNAAKEKCEKPVAVSCPDGQTRNPQTKKCETVIIPSQAKANFTLIFHDHIVANDGEYSIAVISARGLEVGEKVIERTAEWKGACDAKLRWADEEMDSELLLSSTALEDQSCSLTGKVLTNKGRTIEVDRAEINIEKRHFKITEVNANNVLTVMGPKAQMLLFEVQTNSQSKVTSKVDSATPGCKFAFDGLFILTGVYEGAAASEKCSVTVSFKV